MWYKLSFVLHYLIKNWNKINVLHYRIGNKTSSNILFKSYLISLNLTELTKWANVGQIANSGKPPRVFNIQMNITFI